jgi:hypothetical protein
MSETQRDLARSAALEMKEEAMSKVRRSAIVTWTGTIARGSGMGSRPNDNVHRVTGAPPIKFADFAGRTAQAWT